MRTGPGAPPVGVAFPRSPGEITTEWLNAVLRRAGVLDGRAVESVAVQPAAAGYGYVSSHLRLALRWSRPSPAAPASLFAKLSSPDPAVRAWARTTGHYAREVGFYRDVAPLVSLRTPHCYFAASDSDRGDSLVLLEDFPDAQPGDVLAGCPTRVAEHMFRRVALFHAQWRGKKVATRTPWLKEIDPGDEAAYTERARRSWDTFARKFAGMYSESFATLLDRALRKPAEPRARLAACPRTLAIGDFQLGNALFDRSTGEPVFIDWQTAALLPGAVDLSWFLLSSLAVEQRRADEERLMRAYHDELVRAGVRDYPPEALLQELRLGLGLRLVTVVNALAGLEFSSDRGRQIAAAWIERAAAIAEDHGIAELFS